jgi:peptide maturation system acyl carrier-related protein
MDDLESVKIKGKLLKIFNNRFNIDFNKLENEFFNENLLEDGFRLTSRDLLYIYFDVMREYNITITEEDIVQGKFLTFNGILEIIQKQLKQKALCSSN